MDEQSKLVALENENRDLRDEVRRLELRVAKLTNQTIEAIALLEVARELRVPEATKPDRG